VNFPSLDWYDHHNVPYIALPQNGWMGPIWTGREMILDTKEGYGDPAFFHELCHFLAATPEQRELPDFGLDRVTNGTGERVAIYGLERFSDPASLQDRRGWAGEECVSKREATRQEQLACDAMWFYAPIVLGDWESNEGWREACDFSGMHTPETWGVSQRLRTFFFLRDNFYVDLSVTTFEDYFRDYILTLYPVSL
jgi:hypothetical protein